MDYNDAKADILNYLSLQEDKYFVARNTTREEVQENAVLISHLASEHLACVTRFGCDREWSSKDVCDSFPGISKCGALETQPSLQSQIHSASNRATESLRISDSKEQNQENER